MLAKCDQCHDRQHRPWCPKIGGPGPPVATPKATTPRSTKPRPRPVATFEQTCPVCFTEHKTNKPTTRTCSPACSAIMKNARWLVDPDAHERQRLAIVTWNMDNPSTPARDRATRRQFEYHQQHGFMPPPTKTFGNGKYYKMLWNIGGQELIDRHQAARDAYYAGRPLMPEPDQRLPYCTCGHPRGTHNFRFVYGEGGHYEACRITACGCNSYLVA